MNPTVRVYRQQGEGELASSCIVAESFFTRLKGLIGRKSLNAGEGMFFPNCRDIHMYFMSIPIDVVFLKRESDREYRVSSVHSNVRPWRPLPLVDIKASETLELPVGVIDSLNLQRGEVLCLS